MLNKIIIMGRMTRDPERRYTGSQIPVTSFTLAVERDIKEGGERKTDFIDCIAWRSAADFVANYFTKGSMAVVAGRLALRDWTDRDGNKRRSAEVVADNIYFGESKRDKAEVDYARAERGGTCAEPPAPSGFGELSDINDGDLPF